MKPISLNERKYDVNVSFLVDLYNDIADETEKAWMLDEVYKKVGYTAIPTVDDEIIYDSEDLRMNLKVIGVKKVYSETHDCDGNISHIDLEIRVELDWIDEEYVRYKWENEETDDEKL